jgi:flagellar assembly protein FliH
MVSEHQGMAAPPHRSTADDHAGDAASVSRRRQEPLAQDVDLDSLQQAARQAGYHDGYRDGLAALDNFKRSFAQQMATQVGHLIRSMDSELQALEADMAQAIINAATGLARQIVRSELATRPELVTQVAREAVAALSQSVRRIEMRVHPDDLALVQAGFGEEAVARGVTCIGDAGISRGGCILQSELGSVDARIEHQWELALRCAAQDPTHWPLQSQDQF